MSETQEVHQSYQMEQYWPKDASAGHWQYFWLLSDQYLESWSSHSQGQTEDVDLAVKAAANLLKQS